MKAVKASARSFVSEICVFVTYLPPTIATVSILQSAADFTLGYFIYFFRNTNYNQTTFILTIHPYFMLTDQTVSIYASHF